MFPVVILAAGGGKRLGPLGMAYPKALLPIGQGPLLFWHFESFSQVGATRFILVVDSKDSRVATRARQLAMTQGLELDIVVQPEPRGIGHATLLAAPYVGHSPFALVLGDTFYVPRDLLTGMHMVKEGGCDAVLSIRLVRDEAAIRRECTIELDPDGVVRRIVEKPIEVLGPYKPCGVYFFGPAMFDALRRTPPSSLRNEVELTDAIEILIETGGRVRGVTTLESDFNITVPSDLIDANMAWLEAQGVSVSVAESARIGNGVALDKVVVGDGACVGDGAVLRSVVVFPEARVDSNEIIEDALVVPNLGVVR